MSTRPVRDCPPLAAGASSGWGDCRLSPPRLQTVLPQYGSGRTRAGTAGLALAGGDGPADDRGGPADPADRQLSGEAGAQPNSDWHTHTLPLAQPVRTTTKRLRSQVRQSKGAI